MENNLAVLIDFENIAAGTEKEGLGRFDVEALMQRVKDKGRILLARSYADWGRFSRFKQSLLGQNVTMYELTSHGMNDKNRADIAMVVDALELAFTRDYIDTFVVVSGDSDFTPMVLKMRELNKRVIGIGTRRSTSRLLVQACDEFIFYESIVSKKTIQRPRPSSRSKGELMTLDNAFVLLEDAIAGLQRENPDSPLASVVKSAMRRKSPDFSESDLGFSSFARFLDSARKAGKVETTRDQKSGGYRVAVLDDSDSLLEVGGGGKNASKKISDWIDAYLPKGSELFVDTLDQAKIHPLSAPTRLAILEAIQTAVQERNKRKRRTTIPFIRDDVKRKLRTTHPDLPGRLIRGILNALMDSGQLLHHDGHPIRSPSANFGIQKNAEELNISLVSFYLGKLKQAGVDLTKVDVLSDLLLGDPERRKEIEETVAWLVVPEAPPSDDDSQVTLDDLLEMETDAPSFEATKGDDDGSSSLDALLDAPATAEAPEAPPSEVAEEPAPDEVAEEPAPDEVAEAATEEAVVVDEAPEAEKRPAVRKRKRTRKPDTKDETPDEA